METIWEDKIIKLSKKPTSYKKTKKAIMSFIKLLTPLNLHGKWRKTTKG